MKVSRVLLTLAITASSLAFVSPSFADKADDERRSIQLFEDARKLAKDGRCADAIPILHESVRLAPSVGSLLNLGLCYQTAGKTATAHRWFKKAEELATTKSDPRRDEASTRARDLEASLSTITIVVPTPANKPDLSVLVDDVAVPREQWGMPMSTDPGAHVIEVRSSAVGRRIERVNVRANGDHAQFYVPSEPAPEPTSNTTEKSPSRPMRTIGFAAGGVGLAALVAGSVLGVLALRARSDLDARCPEYPTCPASDRVEVDKLNSREGTFADASTWSFVGAGVLLVSSGILVFTTP
jgi:hypothetical protein